MYTCCPITRLRPPGSLQWQPECRAGLITWCEPGCCCQLWNASRKTTPCPVTWWVKDPSFAHSHSFARTALNVAWWHLRADGSWCSCMGSNCWSSGTWASHTDSESCFDTYTTVRQWKHYGWNGLGAFDNNTVNICHWWSVYNMTALCNLLYIYYFMFTTTLEVASMISTPFQNEAYWD